MPMPYPRLQRSNSTMSIYRKKTYNNSSPTNSISGDILRKYRLCLKYVPKDVSIDRIEKLCSQYGKVLQVTNSPKTPYKFVSFSSLSEMERALIGLKDNQYGFFADVAKQKNQNNDENESFLDIINDDDDDEDDKRSRNNSFNKNKNNSHYQQRHRQNRARSVEKTTTKSRTMETPNKKPSANVIQQETTTQATPKPTQPSTSSSELHPQNTTTQQMNNTNIIENDVIGHCALCMKWGNKACGRCGDCYCSLDCQRNDWKRHRYFCLAMPHLVPLTREQQESRMVNGHHTAIQAPAPSQMISGYGNPQHGPPLMAGGHGNPQQGPPLMAGGYGNSQQGQLLMYNAYNNTVQQQSVMAQNQNHMLALKLSGQIASSNYNFPQAPTTIPISQHNNPTSGPSGMTSNSKSKTNMNYQSKKNVANKEIIKPIAQTASVQKEKEKEQEITKPITQTTPVQKENEKPNECLIAAEIKKQTSEESKLKENSSAAPAPSTAVVTVTETKSTTTVNESLALDEPDVSKIPAADFPESGGRVQITAVLKPNLLYVRSLAADREYLGIVNKISNEAKKSARLQNLPKTGDFVAADFVEFGCYRAIVLDPIHANKIIVKFIDNGMIEEKCLSDLKELPPEVMNFKRYVFPVRLKGISDAQFNSNSSKKECAMEYLDEFIDCLSKDFKIVYENVGDGVEVIDLSCNKSINEHVANLLK